MKFWTFLDIFAFLSLSKLKSNFLTFQDSLLEFYKGHPKLLSNLEGLEIKLDSSGSINNFNSIIKLKFKKRKKLK